MEDKIKDKIVEINTSSQHLKGLLEVISEMYLVEPSHIEYVKVGDIEQAKITFIPVKPEIRIECNDDIKINDVIEKLNCANKETSDNIKDLSDTIVETGRFNCKEPNESNGPKEESLDRHKCSSNFCETYIPGNSEYCTVCLKTAPLEDEETVEPWYKCIDCKDLLPIGHNPDIACPKCTPCDNNECVLKHNTDTECKH